MRRWARSVGVIAVMSLACVSTSPRHHRAAYVVDGAIVAAGLITLVAGGAVHATCAAGEASCQGGADAAMETGGVIAFVGLAGAIANWLATPWQPCNLTPAGAGAPDPAPCPVR